MPKTLLVSELREILNLIKLGLSGNAIARKTGVSRPTVHKIIRGDRPPYAIQHVWLEDDPQYTECLAYRCPTCGATVTTRPCRYCTQKTI